MSRGALAGIERADRYALTVDPEIVRGTIDTARDLIEQRGLAASDRFQELFGELTAIATLARLTYDEAALAAEDIDDYLGHSVAFFNSFRHA